MLNKFYEQLGKKIFVLRRNQKLSRERFAELAGINDYYLGEIERGEKKLLWIFSSKYQKFSG